MAKADLYDSSFTIEEGCNDDSKPDENNSKMYHNDDLYDDNCENIHEDIKKQIVN